MATGDASCLLTNQGRQLFDRVAVWVGWSLGVTLIMVSSVWEVMPVRLLGFVMLFGVATFTACLSIHRRDDVIHAAYEMGRATGAGEVTSLR